MLRAFRFWWACVREAAKGTLDKANAWSWAIGLPIGAIASWYWEIGESTIPDQPRDFFIFMGVTGRLARLWFSQSDFSARHHASMRALKMKKSNFRQN